MKINSEVQRLWVVPALAIVCTAMMAGCGGGKYAAGGTGPTPTPTPVPSPPAGAACTTPPVTITHTASTVSAAQIVFVDTAAYPQAVCNDGTPAAYIIRPGVGAAATRWVISLEGGSECYDQTTCSARAANSPQRVSSTPYRSGPFSVATLSGLQSPDASTNPDFYDATQVQALYCSSDDWSGAKMGAGTFNANDVTTWDFEGHAVLASILADLTANHGLANATEVLFTGESAGGVGVFANVNTVTGLVPSGARFVAGEDAGYGNIVQNFLATGTPPNYTDPTGTPAEVAKREPGLVLWNGSGDKACNAAATTPLEQVDCYSGAQLLGAGGTIALPMFVSESQQDTAQLATDGVTAGLSTGQFTTAEAGYVSYFATQMKLTLALANANVSVFSPDVLVHTEDTDALFTANYSFPAGNLTLQQAEGAWYKAPCSAERNVAN